MYNFPLSGVQFVALVAELHHMTAENQRLRELIDRANNDYNALHKHLMKLMQEQQHKQEVIINI